MKISVLIITYKRLELLQKCLSSLQELQGLGDVFVHVLVNGEDDLESSAFLQNHFQKEEKCSWSVRPQSLPGVSRNESLRFISENTDWVYFFDDAAYLPKGYGKIISQSLTHKDGLDVLGGPDRIPAQSPWMEKSLAIALASPFCTGLTYVRHAQFFYRGRPQGPTRSSEEQLSVCNLWIKAEVLQKLGDRPFLETWRSGEEMIVLKQIQQFSEKIFFDSRAFVFHAREGNVLSILRASFWRGFYRSTYLREVSDRKWFYLAPLFFWLHFSFLVDHEFFLLGIKLYFLVVGIISLGLSQKSRSTVLAPVVFLLHYFIVLFYALGFQYAWIKNQKEYTQFIVS